MALQLAAAGADVVVHCRQNLAGANRVADGVRALGRQCLVLAVDLANADSHAAFVTQAWDWQGRVDIWVNNAGADVLTGEARDWSFARKLDQLWHVDVLATMQLTRLVGARMIERDAAAGDATIINVGWDQVEQGMEGDSGEMFAAIKGAIMAFTRSAARSLAPRVRVNCVAPGWIRTAWGEQTSDYWNQRAIGESLMGRWGEADDVARVVRFLSSEAASFLTGLIVPVNGGRR